MRKYYTRPCNFHYGNYAKKLIRRKKALSLAGNLNIAFDHLEIFLRKKKGFTESKIYSLSEIKDLDNKILLLIKADLNTIYNIFKTAGYYFVEIDVQVQKNKNKTVNIIYHAFSINPFLLQD